MGMTEETTAARPPAGWLLDATTGQTRWWDGVQWTEHVKPAEPAPVTMAPTRASLRAAAQASSQPLPSEASIHDPTESGPNLPDPSISRPAYAATSLQYAAPSPGYVTPSRYPGPSFPQAPPTSKNGPAKASLILLLLLVLGVGAVFWFLSGQDPAVAAVLGLLNIAMVLAAFILAIIGLVIAVRRPTKKRESVFALVLSSLLMVFTAARLVLGFTTMVIDVPVLEEQIASWAGQQTGEAFQVDCPTAATATPGTTFTCAAVGDGGTAWSLLVSFNADNTVAWEVVG